MNVNAETKICSQCKIEKDISSFLFRKDQNRYIAKCKECLHAKNRKYYYENREALLQQKQRYYEENREEKLNYNKEYYASSKEDILLQKREYYQNNKNQILEDRKIYYEENKEELNRQHREYYINNVEKFEIYYLNNRDRILEDKKQHRENNKELFLEKERKKREDNREELKIYKNEYEKTRKAQDPVYKLKTLISSRILSALKEAGSSKNGHATLTYLKYSIKELKQHLENQFEPWMTWKNHGRYNPKTWNDNEQSTWTWQLDHIIPHSEFLYTTMEDENFKKCWALENLRPLSSKQNLLDELTRVRHNNINQMQENI